MWHAKEARQYMMAFMGIFVLFLLFRAVLSFLNDTWFGMHYLRMLAQIVCVLIVSYWMLTVQSRIMHRKIRQLMLGIGALFLLYYIMQMMKYCLFEGDPDLCRYIWYGYYIPMTMIPVLVFFIPNHLSVSNKWEGGKYWIPVTAIALCICLGFLTNDVHQLAFRIPNWYEDGDKGRTFGPVYYLYLVFMTGLFLLGMRRIFHLYQSGMDKRKLVYPAIPIAIGIIYVYGMESSWTMIGNHRILELSEILTFMIIGFLEMCIQIGLIPSNMGYGKLFSMSDISARVQSVDGKTVFETRGAEKGFGESVDHRIARSAVKGGHFFYDIDLRNLNRLNRELQEITVNLESRNELLRHENEIMNQRNQSEEATRIYDAVAELVRPQVLEVRALLSGDMADEDRLRANLIRSALLNAYIKRRSNMALEARKNGTLTFRELATAVAESLEYFKLSGAETFLSFSGEGTCPAEEIVGAYLAFENVVEMILGKVDYLTVRISLEDIICIRFLFSGREELPDFDILKPDCGTMEYHQLDCDTELIIRCRKGGDGA